MLKTVHVGGTQDHEEDDDPKPQTPVQFNKKNLQLFVLD
jgi:hypothetical protein